MIRGFDDLELCRLIVGRNDALIEFLRNNLIVSAGDLYVFLSDNISVANHVIDKLIWGKIIDAKRWDRKKRQGTFESLIFEGELYKPSEKPTEEKKENDDLQKPKVRKKQRK